MSAQLRLGTLTRILTARSQSRLSSEVSHALVENYGSHSNAQAFDHFRKLSVRQLDNDILQLGHHVLSEPIEKSNQG
jgi:hypothetical protein